MNLKPLGDRVIVKPNAPKKQQKAVSYCPILHRKSPWKAKLVAVGNGKTDDAGKKIAMELKGRR